MPTFAQRSNIRTSIASGFEPFIASFIRAAAETRQARRVDAPVNADRGINTPRSPVLSREAEDFGGDDTGYEFVRQLGHDALRCMRRPRQRPTKGEFLVLTVLACAAAAHINDFVQIVEDVVRCLEPAAEELGAGQLPCFGNCFLLDASLLLAVLRKERFQRIVLI